MLQKHKAEQVLKLVKQDPAKYLRSWPSIFHKILAPQPMEATSDFLTGEQ